MDQKARIPFHLDQIVHVFPYKRNAPEFAKRVSLALLGALPQAHLRVLLGLVLSQHEIQNEPLAPENDLLHDVQRQHP